MSQLEDLQIENQRLREANRRLQASGDALERDRLVVGLREQVSVLTQLIDDLRSQDACLLDHHGYCQAHGWLDSLRCPHARASRLFE